MVFLKGWVETPRPPGRETSPGDGSRRGQRHHRHIPHHTAVGDNAATGAIRHVARMLEDREEAVSAKEIWLTEVLERLFSNKNR